MTIQSNNMSISWPLISVVTPSFNQGRFLERTIRSVLGQDYPRLEYIVMDGGSTDESVDIIRAYEKKLEYWQSQKDGGQPSAINAGTRRSRGELLTFLNSDDVLLPGSLRRVAQASIKYPRTDVFYGHHARIDDDDRLLRVHYHARWITWIAWRSMPYIAQPGTFYRRRLWEEVNGVDESLQFAFDYDLWYRFMAVHARFGKVNLPLACFRIHRESKGQDLQWKRPYAEEVEVIRRRYLSNTGLVSQKLARLIHIGMQFGTLNYFRTFWSIFTRYGKKEFGPDA